VTAIVYPQGLPRMQLWPTVARERRATSGGEGIKAAPRARSRDRIADIDAQWFYKPAHMAVWAPWYEDTLLNGTRWFAINAPGPGGWMQRVCRYRTGTVRREALPGGHWRVSAQLEQRGRSALPQAPDPYIDDVVLHMRMDAVDGFTDLTGRHTVTVSGALTPGGASGLFGRGATQFSSGNYLRVTDNLDDFTVDTGYTFESWMAIDGASAEVAQCVAGTDPWEWFSFDSAASGPNTFLNKTGSGFSFGGGEATPPAMVGAGLIHVAIGCDSVNNYAAVNGKLYITPGPILFGNSTLCIGRNGDAPTLAGFPYWLLGRLQNLRFTQTHWRYGSGATYSVPTGRFPTA
jgi:hypothetical protein